MALSTPGNDEMGTGGEGGEGRRLGAGLGRVDWEEGVREGER